MQPSRGVLFYGPPGCGKFLFTLIFYFSYCSADLKVAYLKLKFAYFCKVKHFAQENDCLLLPIFWSKVQMLWFDLVFRSIEIFCI
jgi:hypothetical protein